MGYTSSAMWPSKLPNKHNRFVNKDNSRGAVAADSVGASNANPKVIGDSDEAAAKDAGKTQIARSPGRTVAQRESVCESEREREGKRGVECDGSGAGCGFYCMAWISAAAAEEERRNGGDIFFSCLGVAVTSSELITATTTAKNVALPAFFCRLQTVDNQPFRSFFLCSR